MATVGTYNITLKRGDSFGGVTFTFTQTSGGAAIALASARAQVRLRTGNKSVIHTFTCTVGGAGSNVVTLSAITGTVSQSFVAGVHAWDLEVTTAAGATKTYVAGTFTITDDVTRS